MIRDRNIVVTTTASLEGFETRAYLGVVSAHVVAGTGLFSDVFASFSDIFGGRSRSYQKQLASINDEVIELLKKIAAARGGNCILGLRIDHDEIAGGSKSMFMVTASGTAAVVNRLRSSGEVVTEPTTVLSADDLDTLVRRQRLAEAAENGKLMLDEGTWEFLCANQVNEVAPSILATVERALTDAYSFPKDFIDRSKSYFHSLPDELVKEHLYPVVAKEEGALQRYALNLLAGMNLLDLNEAEELLRSDDFKARKRGLSLLQLNKATYSVADAEKLKALRQLVESSFGERGRVVEVDQMFSSKAKQKWECECGVKLDMEERYCLKCGHDIYGFSKKETRPEHIADLLARKVAVLRRELSNGSANRAV